MRRALFGESAPQAALLAPASWRFMAPDPGVEAWTVWAGAGSAWAMRFMAFVRRQRGALRVTQPTAAPALWSRP